MRFEACLMNESDWLGYKQQFCAEQNIQSEAFQLDF